MMIALVINALLFTALTAVFIANVRHYNTVVSTSRLNQELQMTMQLMTNDIRRAGYWGNARNDVGTHQNNNPFTAAGLDVSISGTNCILFSYDHDNNGTLASISSSIDDERYGFRLNNFTVQTRPPGAAFDCAASASSWENVTDPNVVRITALTFTLTQRTITTGPGTKGITMRSIDITLTGQLAGDSTITKTLTQHIRIRNDKFIP